MELGVATALALGFLTGFRHAFDPDHVIALSTLLHQDPRLGRALRTGAAWGLGHTTTLAAATLLVSGLQLQIVPDHTRLFEAPVAVMLVALGFWAILSSIRRLRRLQRHRHDGIEHLHVGPRPHPHGFRASWSGYLIGLVHGFAGSAALLLLVAATLPTMYHGLLYALVFGTGSLFGMAVVTIALALPLMRSKRSPLVFNALTGISGLASVGLGLWIAGELLR